MKKAFTLLELVFVIILIGILASIFWSKNYSNKAGEAAAQIISHIRYTQHLALSDDKFDANDANWYKKLWRIGFNNNAQCSESGKNEWCYAVYNNISGTFSEAGQPNGVNEAAPNPALPGKYLSAKYPGFASNYSKNMNLTQTFKITNIDFKEFASNGIQGIIFDELGRAYPRGEWAMPYDNGKRQFKLGDGAFGRIKLSASDGSTASILVFKETGFACLEGSEGCLAPTK